MNMFLPQMGSRVFQDFPAPLRTRHTRRRTCKYCKGPVFWQDKVLMDKQGEHTCVEKLLFQSERSVHSRINYFNMGAVRNLRHKYRTSCSSDAFKMFLKHRYGRVPNLDLIVPILNLKGAEFTSQSTTLPVFEGTHYMNIPFDNIMKSFRSLIDSGNPAYAITFGSFRIGQESFKGPLLSLLKKSGDGVAELTIQGSALELVVPEREGLNQGSFASFRSRAVEREWPVSMDVGSSTYEPTDRGVERIRGVPPTEFHFDTPPTLIPSSNISMHEIEVERAIRREEIRRRFESIHATNFDQAFQNIVQVGSLNMDSED